MEDPNSDSNTQVTTNKPNILSNLHIDKKCPLNIILDAFEFKNNLLVTGITFQKSTIATV